MLLRLIRFKHYRKPIQSSVSANGKLHFYPKTKTENCQSCYRNEVVSDRRFSDQQLILIDFPTLYLLVPGAILFGHFGGNFVKLQSLKYKRITNGLPSGGAVIILPSLSPGQIFAPFERFLIPELFLLPSRISLTLVRAEIHLKRSVIIRRLFFL